jgi:hypothetical protein
MTSSEKKSNVSKIYRKLVTVRSEFHAFQLLERLDGDMCRIILQQMISQKFQNPN